MTVPPPDWPFGTSALARLVRERDWAQTPLGPIAGWPAPLRTAVDLILDAPVAMIVLWGDDLVQIYNDAYREIMGSKHPEGLGQPNRDCWPEVWSFNAPIYEAVRAGQNRSYADQKLWLGGRGGMRPAYFDLSYSPLRERDGRVAGVLVTVVETTARVLAEGRQTFRLALERSLRALRDSEAVLQTVVEALARELGADEAGFAPLGAGRGEGGLVISHSFGPAPILGGQTIALRAGHLERLEGGRPIVIDGSGGGGPELSGPLPDFAACLLIPQMENGVLAGVFAVASRAPRIWTSDEVMLAEEAADRGSVGLARARAEEALSRSEAIFRQIAEANLIGVGFGDGRGVITYVNEEMLRMMGRERAEIESGRLTISDVIAPEDRAGLAATDAVLRASGQVVGYERSFLRPDGGRTPFVGAAALVASGAGDHVSIALDLTRVRTAESALREREAATRALFEAIDEGYALCALETDETGLATDYRFLDVNPRFEAMLGLRQVRGRRAQELGPDFLPFWRTTFGRMAASGESVRFQSEPDARGRIFDVFTMPMEPRGRFALVISDITDRLRAETALRDSEARFRLIVESARDYAIYTTDREGRIDSWPAGAQAVFGWSPQEAIGRLDALLDTPEDRLAGQSARERALAREAGLAADERWHVCKDGRPVFISGSVRALQAGDGSVRGYLRIGQDVTRRQETEQALLAAERRQRALVEGIPQLVWRSAGRGVWTWASPQWRAYTGQSEEESLGLVWLEAVHPDDREKVLAAWSDADGRGAYTCDHRLYHAAENRCRWVQTRSAPLRDEAGRIVEWLGTSTDVDELRTLQSEQEVLVAELQHRTRNLIAVVRSVAAQTLDRSSSLEAFRDRFNKRLGALARVQGLLSRTERQSITIGSVLQMELDALGTDAAATRVVVEGPEVRLRKSAVQTLALAIHELATNALKYGALAVPEGRLEVRWRIELAEDGEERLRLDWHEEGLDVAEAARNGTRRGYGRILIEEALPYSLGATTEYHLDSDKVHFSISLPLARRGNTAPG
ncbi:MAG: PAS domain S-box protein [Alphaproteobacteria bacterium]|nr:PAS domain S-box protein [Alphaproteobacteria bacterium]